MVQKERKGQSSYPCLEEALEVPGLATTAALGLGAGLAATAAYGRERRALGPYLSFLFRGIGGNCVFV